MALDDATKKRIQKAMEKFEDKQRKIDSGPRRKNDDPENLVVKDCLAWMRANNWNVNVYEAKATFSPTAGRWINQSMQPGISDIGGSEATGIGAWIECKAPGCRIASRLRDNQREFLVNKIHANNFAIVTDSVVYLEKTYQRWLEIRAQDPQRAKVFLLGQLP